MGLLQKNSKNKAEKKHKGLSLKIHPLFILLGLVMVVTGRGLIFFTYLITIILHEIGHSVMASKLGYKLNNMVLMPQGALIYGVSGFNCPKDEIKVALAGPLVNIFLSLLFIAIWWLIPESFIVSENFVYSNIFTAVLNLLPVMPLDGGRVTLAIFDQFKKRKIGIIVTNAIAIIISLSLFILFVFTMFIDANYSFLIMSIFLILGVVFSGKDNRYENMYSQLINKIDLLNGVECNQIVISINSTVMNLMRKLNHKKYNIALLTNELGEVVCTLHQSEIDELLLNNNLKAKLYNIIG